MLYNMSHATKLAHLLGLFHILTTGRIFNGSGNSIDKGPPVLAEDFLDIQGKWPLVNFFVITVAGAT